MNDFVLGFLLSFFVLFAVLVALRLFVYLGPKLYPARRIAYTATSESTDWLNFILFRVTSHFQTDNSIAKINAIVAKKLGEGKFELLTLGNAPTIPQVKTVAMAQQDDIKILVPIEWDGGPSFNFHLIRHSLACEVDLSHFHATVLFSWPGAGCTTLEIRLDPDFALELHIALKIGKLRFSITEAPFLGPVLTGLAAFVISRQVFMIDLPESALEGAPAARNE
jgi:hypothetical protein